MNPTSPLISIIINYFNPDDNPRVVAMIRYCLECYAAYTRHPYELLVVDGSGQPGPALEQHCARGAGVIWFARKKARLPKFTTWG